MYLFFHFATGDLTTESGRTVGNFDTLDAAASAWPDAVLRVVGHR